MAEPVGYAQRIAIARRSTTFPTLLHTLPGGAQRADFSTSSRSGARGALERARSLSLPEHGAASALATSAHSSVFAARERAADCRAATKPSVHPTHGFAPLPTLTVEGDSSERHGCCRSRALRTEARGHADELRRGATGQQCRGRFSWASSGRVLLRARDETTREVGEDVELSLRRGARSSHLSWHAYA